MDWCNSRHSPLLGSEGNSHADFGVHNDPAGPIAPAAFRKPRFREDRVERPFPRTLFQEQTHRFTQSCPSLGDRISATRNIEFRSVAHVRGAFLPYLGGEGNLWKSYSSL